MEDECKPSTSYDVDDKEIVQQYIDENGIMLNRDEFIGDPKDDDLGKEVKMETPHRPIDGIKIEGTVKIEEDCEHLENAPNPKNHHEENFPSTLQAIHSIIPDEYAKKKLCKSEKSRSELVEKCSLTLANPRQHVEKVHLTIQEFKCDHCHFRTNSSERLKDHVGGIHLKTDKFNCEFCDFFTYYPGNLTTHLRRVHFKINQYKCDYCDFHAPFRNKLKVHFRRAHLKECEFCEYGTVFMENLRQHVRSVHLIEMRYTCEFCEFNSCYRETVRKHVKSVHSKSDLYECKYCNYSTFYQSSMRQHLTRVHAKGWELKCEHCDFCTPYPYELTKHVNGVHVKVKRYHCGHCSLSTLSRCNLKRHIKSVHFKNKDFVCKYCGFCAVRLRNLKAHVKSVHLKRRRKLIEGVRSLSHTTHAHNGIDQLSLVKDASFLKYLTELDHDYSKSNGDKFKCGRCEYTSVYRGSMKYHLRIFHVEDKL